MAQGFHYNLSEWQAVQYLCNVCFRGNPFSIFKCPLKQVTENTENKTVDNEKLVFIFLKKRALST